jgi:hypothetical protein
MEKTWKATVAGILEIIAGVGMIIGGIILSHIVILFVIFITAGAISIIGGICALIRRVWGLALAGAIFSIFGFVILGVPALWLIMDAKKEFE